MPAYFFFAVTEILDATKAGEYRSKVIETVERFGGRYLALGGLIEIVEGDWNPGIPVIIRFDTPQQAKAWYESDLYRPLKALRMEAMQCSAILVNGFEHVPTAKGQKLASVSPLNAVRNVSLSRNPTRNMRGVGWPDRDATPPALSSAPSAPSRWRRGRGRT